mmetsp:Transcript_71198/g.137402  ORF Transcript_71198/g.137402 Transcript_71198/m.137402 type:complete len:1020 (+) Transcript_71198:253-3312(+)
MEQLPVQQQFVVSTPHPESLQGGGSGAGGGGNEPRPPHGAEDGRSTSASDGLPSPNGVGGKPATRTEAVLERARRALQHSRTYPRVPARPLGGTDDAIGSLTASPGLLRGASTLSDGAASISEIEALVPPMATTLPIHSNPSAADPPVAVATRVLGAPYVSALGPCGSPLETLLGSQFASTAPPGTPTASQPAGTKVRAAVEHVSRAEAVLRRAKEALQRAQVPGSRTTSRAQSRLQTPLLSATTSRAPTPPPASPAKAAEGQRQPSPEAIEWREATAASASASIAWSNLVDHAALPSGQLLPPDYGVQAAASSAHLPQSTQADHGTLSCAQMPPSGLADQAAAPAAQVPPSDLANQANAPSAHVPSNLADQAAKAAVPEPGSNGAEQIGVPTTVVLPSDLTDQAPSLSSLPPSWADEATATSAPQQLQMVMGAQQPRSEQELQSGAATTADESQLQLPHPPAGYVYSLTQVPNTPDGAPQRRPGGKGVAPAPPPPSAAKLRGKGGPPVPKVGPPKGLLTSESSDGLGKSMSTMSADSSSMHAPFHRKLYWKPLEIDDAEGTIFSELERDRGKAMTFDRDALTRMFEGEKEKSAVLARRSTSMLDRVQTRTAGVKILSDHRARNVAIVLRSLSISTKDLTRIMRQLSWEEMELSTDDLEQVLVVIPTKEEAEMLREYRGAEERKTLRDVEQTVMPFVTLSRCTARLRLMCIARSSRSQFKATDQSLASIRSCCQAIQRSPLLREVMLLALDLGNYINHGDSSKGAKAIAVGSLLTLKDFKTGKMSSLHFLCATMLRMQPDLDVAEELAKELKPVLAVSKLQVQSFMAGMRAFMRDTETVTLECKTYLHEYETASAAEEEQAAHGEQIDDGELEEYEVSSFGEHEAIDADAARFVEDVLKIRGSANRRLQCMRRVQEKLAKYLQTKTELVSGEVHAVLRFCGMAGTKAKEIPVEFEVLTGQLAEFIRVFKSHWNEVKADLSSYEQLFRASGGRGRRGGAGASSSGRATGSAGALRSNTWT